MSKLHVVQQGQGPAIVLSHALGCDLQMWDGVAQALEDRFTVVRYDHRGHGRSPAIGEAFDMNDLADDAAGVIEALGQGSEEHTSELQSPDHLVCRLLLEKKKKKLIEEYINNNP